MRPAALALLLLAAVAPAYGQPDPAAPGLSASARLRALVDRIKLEQRSLHTLEARFIQERESELLVEPELASGTFSFAAPDKVRWDYERPKPMSLVIRGDRMTTWYRDLDRAERVDVGRFSSRVLRYMGAGGSLETLLQYFDLTAAFPRQSDQPYRLELVPRHERMARRVERLTIWIDRGRFLPIRLRYVEPGGDVTELRFQDLRLNAELPPDRFELDLPPGVEVRSLGPDRDSP